MSQDTRQPPSKRRLHSRDPREAKADKTKQEREGAKDQEQSQVQEMKTRTKLVANLHSAANEGKVELVRLLLRCGADVNAQDEQVSLKLRLSHSGCLVIDGSSCSAASSTAIVLASAVAHGHAGHRVGHLHGHRVGHLHGHGVPAAAASAVPAAAAASAVTSTAAAVPAAHHDDHIAALTFALTFALAAGLSRLRREGRHQEESGQHRGHADQADLL